MNVEKNEKRLWHLLIVSVILMVVNNHLFGKDIIHDPNFLFYLPVVVGIVLVVMTRKKFLLFGVKDAGKEKLLVIVNAFKFTIAFFVILNGFIMLPFGFINKAYSEKNLLEKHDLEILRVSDGSSRSWASIRYKFNGKVETFSGSKEVYKLFDRKPKAGEAIGIFRIECRKALFGSYVLERWEII